MIDVTAFRNQTVAVLGLARSGLAAAQALQRGGARVLAWDDAPDEREAAAASGRAARPISPSADLAGRARRWCCRPAFRTPSRSRIRSRRAARAAGIADHRRHRAAGARAAAPRAIVGITGTNGKSTTTALIGHILASRPGAPSRSAAISACRRLLLEALGRERHLCAGDELLSARTHAAASRFDVAVLLNVTPDHLDRHGGMAGYIAAKKRIFAQPDSRRTAAVIGIDDEICPRIAAALRSRRTAADGADLGRRRRSRAASMSRRRQARSTIIDGKAAPVLDLAPLPHLPGRHNWQNAAAAYAAPRALGVDAAAACRHRELPRPGASPGADRRRSTACATSTTARRPTPTRRPRRSPATTTSIGSPAGVPKEGGIAALGAAFPAHPPRLSHRRGGGQLRRDARWPRPPTSMSGTLDQAVASGAPSGARGRQAGRGRAAVAGLRLVRPVQRFRGARRALPRPRREAAREARA